MKLLTKTTLYYVTVSLFMFFFSGIALYQLVKGFEERKVRNELTDQMYRISHDLSHLGESFGRVVFVSGGLVQIEKASETSDKQVLFTDTLVYDNLRDNYLPYKRISFYHENGKDLYKISIYKSIFESDYLIEQIAIIISAIVIVFLLTVFFLYRYFFGRIWSDFFDTIDKIHHFDISYPGKLDFSESMIIEFNQLNQVLKKMIDKISSDFQGLKDFTGNLTHEMQTPLAIIRSKTDLILQDDTVNENQMQLAGEINSETMRLSKLIKALTLFTKLEHNQYPEREEIDFEKLINSKVEIFEDFIEARSIRVNTKIHQNPAIKMNPELADILITNLVKNSVRHNIEGGKISIELSDKRLSIKNSGMELDIHPEILFKRFTKASTHIDSLGIGLSLAQKICDYYGFEITYHYGDGMHEVVVKFRP